MSRITILVLVALGVFMISTPICSYADSHQKFDDEKVQDESLEDKMLLFEDNFPRNQNLNIKIDESNLLKPHRNDFNLIYFAPMSNKLGERWALITVENAVTGQRILKNEHLVATFANGDQSNPINVSESFKPGEQLSITIFFGINKFPIISVQIEQ